VPPAPPQKNFETFYLEIALCGAFWGVLKFIFLSFFFSFLSSTILLVNKDLHLCLPFWCPQGQLAISINQSVLFQATKPIEKGEKYKNTVGLVTQRRTEVSYLQKYGKYNLCSAFTRTLLHEHHLPLNT